MLFDRHLGVLKNNVMNKEQIVEEIRALLKFKLEEVQKQVDELEISRNLDSKSTAGDKHETGRAMAQLEIDRVREQLTKSLDQLASFNQIDFKHNGETVRIGSYVKTKSFKILLGIGLGKIEIQGTTILAISIASPVGQQLLEKKSGDHFNMGSNQITITEIE